MGVTPETRRSNYNNRTALFYSEATEEVIIQYRESLPLALEGWKPAKAIGAMLSMGEVRAARILDPFKDEAREMIAANHVSTLHYPPNAVEYAVRQAAKENEIPYADETDISLKALSGVMQRHQSWIKNRLSYIDVDTVTKRNPANNQTLHYLSPNPQQALESLPEDILRLKPELFRQEKQRKDLSDKAIQLSTNKDRIITVKHIPVRPREEVFPKAMNYVKKAPYLGEVNAADEVDPLAWREFGVCTQTDPELFFPSQHDSSRNAKLMCASCDVAAQCLQYALNNNENFGVWGGLSAFERRKLKKSQPVMT